MLIDIRRIQQNTHQHQLRAKELMTTITDAEHTWEHVLDVIDNAIEILKRISIDDTLDLDMLFTCIYWHDVGRTVSSQGHEERSADMLAAFLHSQNYSTVYIGRCIASIVNHKYNAPTPTTKEGIILRDADKLAWIGLRRWHSCIKAKQRLDDICTLLPLLREEILILPESRHILDKQLPIFIAEIHNNIMIGE